MSDIFISYKREDKAKAQIIAKILRLKDFSVFWDPDIDIGDIYDERIQNELDSAKCVMVLWSKKSVKSENVRAEATSGKNRLIPVLIEHVNIPVPFNLIQTANLIDWEGSQSHPDFLKLLKKISEIVGRSPQQEKEPKKYKPATPTKQMGRRSLPRNKKLSLMDDLVKYW